MPLFFQHVIDDATQLAIWKIEEEEAFFLQYVPLERNITHHHKRLQHLAGRYLLKHLFPQFPLSLIQIADTRKPFLENEAYHFSISHCGDFAGVIVSKNKRVGIDIELVTLKIQNIQHKFVAKEEWELGVKSWEAEKKREGTMINGPCSIGNDHLYGAPNFHLLTLIWSCKEALFKWYGQGQVDFINHMTLQQLRTGSELPYELKFMFKKNEDLLLDLHSCFFNDLVLSYIVT
jgi:phosphopantetheinyl transferase